MEIWLLIISAIVGFIIMALLSGKKEGDRGAFILLIKTKTGTYHLHHWIIAAVILIILYMLEFHNNIIYGLLIGILIQGLTYKDFYKIVTKQKK